MAGGVRPDLGLAGWPLGPGAGLHDPGVHQPVGRGQPAEVASRRLLFSPQAQNDVDEDELLAELEYEEEELAATASSDEGGSFEIILVGVLTVSLLVGGSALAAG